MAIFNFNDLSKQAKIGYNALYNVILSHSNEFNAKTGLNRFTVPLCLNSENKIALTEKNFIFFDSVLKELGFFGYYTIINHKGRAVDEVKTDFSTVEITVCKSQLEVPRGLKKFDFSNVDTSKLFKRDGKTEKIKTEENKTKKLEEKKEQENTSKALEEKTAEVETLKKVVQQKDEQLQKQKIAEFNDEALLSIADSIEFLIKKHCPMLPDNFDFSTFEVDLFKVINAKWDLKVLNK